MRILLVEDDLAAARGVSLMLKSSGAASDEASFDLVSAMREASH
jgi:DNA-binding response OmpR family regulator